LLRAERGDIDALQARADTGDQSAAYRLADILAKRADIEVLRLEVLRGNTSAIDGLIEGFTKQNSRSAERLRCWGLDPDGSFPGPA
jgi:hypothetical protein